MIFNTPSACGGVIPLNRALGLALGFNTFYSKPRGRSTGWGKSCLASFKKRLRDPTLARVKGYS